MRIEEIIGKRVAACRAEAGLSQRELGKRVGDLVGREWSRQSIWAAETGQRAFTAVEALAFALIFGISVDQLFWVPPDVPEVEMAEGVRISRELLRGPTRRRSIGDQARADLEDDVQSLSELQVLQNAQIARMKGSLLLTATTEMDPEDPPEPDDQD